MGMTVSAILSFGILYEPTEDEKFATRFNIPEEYEEDWIEYIYDSGVAEAHRCGYWESDNCIISVPNSYISIDWSEVLDVDKFINSPSKFSIGDLVKFNTWLKDHGLTDKPAWLMSTYYG